MRIALIAVRIAVVVVALAAAAFFFLSAPGQDMVLDRVLPAAFRTSPAAVADDALGVFVCGSSSPLVDPDRAQACVAVMAGPRLYVVDAGAGSSNVLQRANLPLEHLEGVLLTHFHSDHIAALSDLGLNAWVAGRTEALEVYGPEGVQRVVAGFNEAYGADREYRTAHHGEDLLPPAGGLLVARPVKPGVVVDEAGLEIIAFATDHAPVSPTLGYRFTFNGRSVVVSGDTNAVPDTLRAATGADLLLHDALSETLITRMAAAAEPNRPRLARILTDVLDYHAHTDAVATLAREAGVRLLVLYHLVPPPRNFLIEQVFRRGLPDDAVLARDGMLFELPAGSSAIETHNLL